MAGPSERAAHDADALEASARGAERIGAVMSLLVAATPFLMRVNLLAFPFFVGATGSAIYAAYLLVRGRPAAGRNILGFAGVFVMALSFTSSDSGGEGPLYLAAIVAVLVAPVALVVIAIMMAVRAERLRRRAWAVRRAARAVLPPVPPNLLRSPMSPDDD